MRRKAPAICSCSLSLPILLWPRSLCGPMAFPQNVGPSQTPALCLFLPADCLWLACTKKDFWQLAIVCDGHAAVEALIPKFRWRFAFTSIALLLALGIL